jgi:hypothetical protein
VWNTLFVRSDPAVAAAAAALGVERGAVLDVDARNLAVRAALAETRVVADTKAFLAAAGVRLGILLLPGRALHLVAFEPLISKNEILYRIGAVVENNPLHAIFRIYLMLEAGD